MDSKYAVFGGDKLKTTNFKRKATNDNLKVKKFKLSVENSPVINGCITQNIKNEPVIPKDSSKENLLDSRRKLPVYNVRNRLLEEIKRNHTMILIGETGSGKTTQIPQLIHEQRLEGSLAIAVTQPRRVAAITVALRVAAEMNTEVGSIVGYSVRFEDVTSSRTKVKYLTDGMLLREAITDPLLQRYSVVILDEAHERTVSTDVLFGIVKLAQKERSKQKLTPLKVIVMSATMDVDSFSKYFDNCPVIYLEGRTYPVTIYHVKTKHEDYQYAAICTIFQLHSTTPANYDFLVFLTGQEEIETLMYNIKQIAKEASGPPIRVCPLYAGLPPAKQLQVWKDTPQGTRKIVLATNIAEASVTIPHIKCVIDTGVVKESVGIVSCGARSFLPTPQGLWREDIVKTMVIVTSMRIKCSCTGLESEGVFNSWAFHKGLIQKSQELGTTYINAEVVGFQLEQQRDVLMEGVAPGSFERINKVVYRTPDDQEYSIKFAACILAAGDESGQVAKLAKVGVGDGLLSIPLPIEQRSVTVYSIEDEAARITGLNTPLIMDTSGLWLRRNDIENSLICGHIPFITEETKNLTEDEYYKNIIEPSLNNRFPLANGKKVKKLKGEIQDFNNFDESGILGPHPYHNNLYIAAGFGKYGCQHAPGIGRAIAELIIDSNYTSIDLSRFSFDRILVHEPLMEYDVY